MNNKRQRNKLFTMLMLVMAILMPYEGTEKVPVFEKSCFIQLSISGCRELRQTDSNK